LTYLPDSFFIPCQKVVLGAIWVFLCGPFSPLVAVCIFFPQGKQISQHACPSSSPPPFDLLVRGSIPVDLISFLIHKMISTHTSSPRSQPRFFPLSAPPPILIVCINTTHACLLNFLFALPPSSPLLDTGFYVPTSDQPIFFFSSPPPFSSAPPIMCREVPPFHQ